MLIVLVTFLLLPCIKSNYCDCEDSCDWQCYLDNYQDLQAAFGTNLGSAKNHYYTSGQDEGRNCQCQCDWQCYLDNYLDLQIAFGATNVAAAKTHYYTSGQNEGRNCQCECDWLCYLDNYPDLQTAFGATNVAAAKNHYYTNGKNEGRNCQCTDDCDWECYIENYPDLQDPFGCNLESAKDHYYTSGKNEGRNCQCECNYKCYLDNYLDLQIAFGADNVDAASNHYQTSGKNEGRDCQCECNWQCYLDNYQDLQTAFGVDNIDAAKDHYYTSGQNEGRNCQCQCDWQCYLDNYSDLRDAFGPNNLASAKDHYYTSGQNEGRNCQCECNWQCYLDRYSDLQTAFGESLSSAKNHYYVSGKDEGRNCQCSSGEIINKKSDYAARFAPILRFDRAASSYGYPQNAQTYLNHGGENTVLDTVSNPTYYRVADCCESSTIKVRYWWWYGYQHQCDDVGNGEHEGDWENIIVHINKFSEKVEKVTFHQHGGGYTALASEMYFDGVHPIVYVGKIAHGSYYDSNDYMGGCGYFYDFRNPAGSGDYLETKRNLINLDDNIEDWMLNPSANNMVLTCCANPLTSYYDDICDSDGCEDRGCDWKNCDSTDDLVLDAFDCSGTTDMIEGWWDDFVGLFAHSVGNNVDSKKPSKTVYLSIWVLIFMSIFCILLISTIIMIIGICQNKRSKYYESVEIMTDSEYPDQEL